MVYYPRGSIYTTIMELGPKRPSLLWFWDPNSIIGVFMDPLGIGALIIRMGVPLKESAGSIRVTTRDL